MTKKIKNLFDYAQDKNYRLLFESTGITYPTIEGNTSNFLNDYIANAEYLDKMFYARYASMKPILPDENIDAFFINWKSSIQAVLYFYLEAWARLYYALHLDYNPIYNVDGETSTRTQGKTEGLSGTDATTYNRDQHVKTETRGARGATDTNYEVPFDTTTEKEVGKTVSSDDQYTDTFTEQANIDTDSTAYGKQNNVDYTVTEVRKGNIGVTMTQQMLNSEFDLRKRSFWDNVFKAICKELLYW